MIGIENLRLGIAQLQNIASVHDLDKRRDGMVGLPRAAPSQKWIRHQSFVMPRRSNVWRGAQSRQGLPEPEIIRQIGRHARLAKMLEMRIFSHPSRILVYERYSLFGRPATRQNAFAVSENGRPHLHKDSI